MAWMGGAVAAAAATACIRHCPNCGLQVDPYARFCPRCGCEIPRPSAGMVFGLSALVIFTFVFLLITWIFFYFR